MAGTFAGAKMPAGGFCPALFTDRPAKVAEHPAIFAHKTNAARGLPPRCF
jgi:hypothetical protein